MPQLSGPGDEQPSRDLGHHLARGSDMAEGTCSVDACEKPARNRGWCSAHYERWRKTGDVRADEPLRLKGGSLEDYFWPKVQRTEGCWTWMANRTVRGYGLFTYGGHTHSVHRLSYELLVGPIPDGLQIDHLCRNPPCVNPAHLEPVTFAENQRRRFVLLTHCKRGHEQTDQNVIVGGDGGRRCRLCQRDRIREWKLAKRRTDAAAAGD